MCCVQNVCGGLWVHLCASWNGADDGALLPSGSKCVTDSSTAEYRSAERFRSDIGMAVARTRASTYTGTLVPDTRYFVPRSTCHVVLRRCVPYQHEVPTAVS